MPRLQRNGMLNVTYRWKQVSRLKHSLVVIQEFLNRRGVSGIVGTTPESVTFIINDFSHPWRALFFNWTAFNSKECTLCLLDGV